MNPILLLENCSFRNLEIMLLSLAAATWWIVSDTVKFIPPIDRRSERCPCEHKPATRYQTCQSEVQRLLSLGKFQSAGRFADEALSLRYGTTTDSTGRDEWFVDDLILLGRYSDAKKILESLPPVARTPAGRYARAPILGYRRILLAELLIGLGNFEAAIEELEKPLPELYEKNTEWKSIFSLQGIAYCGVGDTKSAMAKFKQRREPDAEDKLLCAQVDNFTCHCLDCRSMTKIPHARQKRESKHSGSHLQRMRYPS